MFDESKPYLQPLLDLKSDDKVVILTNFVEDEISNVLVSKDITLKKNSKIVFTIPTAGSFCQFLPDCLLLDRNLNRSGLLFSHQFIFHREYPRAVLGITLRVRTFR